MLLKSTCYYFDFLNLYQLINQSLIFHLKLADYNQIIENFTFPVSLITSEKVFSIDTKFGLGFVYKKIRGDLPEFYSYSKWNNIDILLIDKNIAIVNASFSRYDKDDEKFYDGNGIYQLKKVDTEWKIFSLIPFQSIETL